MSCKMSCIFSDCAGIAVIVLMLINSVLHLHFCSMFVVKTDSDLVIKLFVLSVGVIFTYY